jgi:peptidoglycan hydrolase-like protein with peptidoglycan-binding domain
VRALQQRLIARGFAIPAGPTGYYGAQTAGAVAAFQRSQGWSGSEADGAVGPETLKRLGLSFGASPAASVSTAPAKVSAPKSPGTSQVTPPSTRLLSKKKTKKLQRALIRRGFRIPSGPTGKYGIETTRAVAAYQRSQGWSGSNADGIAGATTLRRLGVKPPKSTPKATKVRRTTKSTSTSRKSTTKWDPNTAILVYNLQGALISRGYSIPAGQTGYFGPRTKQAVKAFQRDQGWRGSQADGIPGSGTLKRLGL